MNPCICFSDSPFFYPCATCQNIASIDYFREASEEQSKTFLVLTHSEMQRCWGRPWRALVSAAGWPVFAIYNFVCLLPKNTPIPRSMCLLLFSSNQRICVWKHWAAFFINPIFVCASRNRRECHYRVTGKSLQQAACAFAPILQNCLWKGNRLDNFLVCKVPTHIWALRSITQSCQMWLGKLLVRAVRGDGQGAGVCTTMKMERGLNVLIAHFGCAAELLV